MGCEVCGAVIAIRSGRVPRFCSNACRQREYRARSKRRARFMRLAEGRWVRARGKVPLTVGGRAASSTDASTWSSHAAVISSSAGDGLGVMCGGGLACLDLDDCFVGGVLAGWARDAIDGLNGPVLFAERSVSGGGLHVFHEAPEGPGSSCGGVEIYSRARFIRTTFNEVHIKA